MRSSVLLRPEPGPTFIGLFVPTNQPPPSLPPPVSRPIHTAGAVSWAQFPGGSTLPGQPCSGRLSLSCPDLQARVCGPTGARAKSAPGANYTPSPLNCARRSHDTWRLAPGPPQATPWHAIYWLFVISPGAKLYHLMPSKPYTCHLNPRYHTH